MKLLRYKPDHPVMLGDQLCPQIRCGVEVDELEVRSGLVWARSGDRQWVLVGTRGVADVEAPPPRRGRPPKEEA